MTVVQANGSTVGFEGNPEVAGELKSPRWSQAKLVVESDGTFLYTLPDQETYHFSKEGRLLSETDRNGNATVLSYSETGRLETITDAAGRKIKLTYNSEGLVEAAEDPLGHVVKYTYEAGSLKSVTQPAGTGLRWQFKYDSSHQMTELVDGRGGKTINEYNTSHQVISQKDAMERLTKFEYEHEGSGTFLGGAASTAEETTGEEREPEMSSKAEEEAYLAYITSPPSPPRFVTLIKHEATKEVTQEHFNSEDQLTSLTRGYGTSSATTESFTYNENGYMTSKTDGNEHTTKYGYNASDDRTSMTNPDGDETK